MRDRPEAETLRPVPRPARRHASRRWVRRLEPLFYVLPCLLLLATIYVVPLLDLARLSFARANLIRGFIGWAGLANYRYVVSADFLQVMWRTAIWLGVTVPACMVVGVAVALLLHRPLPGRGLFRVLVILPWLFPEALLGIMWTWVVHSHYGILNNALIQAGFLKQGMNFLSVQLALATVIVVRIWRGTPFIVMSALAALQSIPKDVEEAALLDGATGWKGLWHITLPLIRPVLLASGLILAAWTMLIFDLVYVMTGGGPNKATQIVSVAMYERAFARGDLGQAAAIALVTLVLVSLMGLLYLRHSREEVSS